MQEDGSVCFTRPHPVNRLFFWTVLQMVTTGSWTSLWTGCFTRFTRGFERGPPVRPSFSPGWLVKRKLWSSAASLEGSGRLKHRSLPPLAEGSSVSHGALVLMEGSFVSKVEAASDQLSAGVKARVGVRGVSQPHIPRQKVV